MVKWDQINVIPPDMPWVLGENGRWHWKGLKYGVFCLFLHYLGDRMYWLLRQGIFCTAKQCFLCNHSGAFRDIAYCEKMYRISCKAKNIRGARLIFPCRLCILKICAKNRVKRGVFKKEDIAKVVFRVFGRGEKHKNGWKIA